MTVFGIGTLELILILLLLILLFGPERIAEMGVWLGRSYKRLLGITSEINQHVADVRKSVTAGLDTTTIGNPLREATNQVGQLRQEIDAEIRNIKPDLAPTPPAVAAPNTTLPPAQQERD